MAINFKRGPVTELTFGQTCSIDYNVFLFQECKVLLLSFSYGSMWPTKYPYILQDLKPTNWLKIFLFWRKFLTDHRWVGSLWQLVGSHSRTQISLPEKFLLTWLWWWGLWPGYPTHLLRDGRRHQNGWIFGKVPNGLFGKSFFKIHPFWWRHPFLLGNWVG